jgi:hypothetical protein
MTTLSLLPNDQVNWNGKQFFYDENGQAHLQHLHWGDDYTLEEGNAIDDVEALQHGIILNDEYNFEEWN